uniref:Uncharacterized protein n=1 Tax=Romanomermis culicivorax TaxID=13658 RepID=A0A915KSP9_ROMCU
MLSRWSQMRVNNHVTVENGKFRYLVQQNQLAKNNETTMTKEAEATPLTNRKTSSLGAITLIALYSYDSRSDGDLSFKKGDLMILLDDQNTDWWYVKHVSSDNTGYVPRNFVAIQKSTESEEWFAGKIGRSIAEKLVNNPDLPRGTFLIRDRETERHGLSQNTNNEYALTIKDYDSVKHYKIKRLEDGGFYITTRKTFSSLEELVQYYSTVADGLCHVLRTPCPRHAPLRPDLSHQTNKNWEIERSELEFYNKIGQGNFGEVWYVVQTLTTQTGQWSMLTMLIQNLVNAILIDWIFLRAILPDSPMESMT